MPVETNSAMADPTTFPEEHVSEPLVYRRISGFAIAAFAMACGFAVITVTLCSVGLIRRSPVLLPASVQVFGVIAFVMALTAQLMIRRSEGTLAGMRLATWGFWVSTVLLVAYWSYYGATYFAVLNQGDTFTRAWFDKFKQSKVIAAFLDTKDPGVRQLVNPEDEEAFRVRFNEPLPRRDMSTKGAFDSFREHELVRLLLQGGAETQVKAQGVKEWDYKKGGGYNVKRAYQVSTPEGVFDVQLTVWGEGRSWFLVWNEATITATALSALGTNIAELRKQSMYKVDEWGRKLALGHLEAAYFDTREPAARTRILNEYASRLALTTFAAGTAPVEGPGVAAIRWGAVLDSELTRRLYLPDYDTLFHRHGILNTDRAQFDAKATRDPVVSGIRDIFAPGLASSRLGGMRVEPHSAQRTWKTEAGRLVMPHDCKLAFQDQGGNSRYGADVVVIAQSDPGPISASRNPTWRILKMELIRGEDRALAAKRMQQESMKAGGSAQ